VHVIVDRLQSGDAAAVLRLLADNELPTDGLLAHLETAVVARVGVHVVACAALEIYRDGALLRSVAVDESVRGRGVGQQIVRAALDLAREHHTPAVYLLTTTAEGFFPRFGFRRIARGEVPLTVQASVEFASACPSTAAVMVREMTAYS
jgi:amino-acid N-acetyltransferase